MIRLVVVALLVSFSSLEVMGQEFKCEDGYVRFISKAPLNSFDGESSYLHGLVNIESNLLDFYIDLNTLKTGIKLRDSHMREDYLETEKYPFAEFTGEIKDLNLYSDQQLKNGVKVLAIGKFKIHGVEKERRITGNIKINDQGNFELKTSFKVLLEDHEIEKPSLLGYQIADEQTVEINAILKKQ